MHLQGEIGHQLFELYALALELVDLMACGVPDHVTGQPLLTGLHELLGPGIVGVGLDTLPPAQVVHRDLSAEALQHDTSPSASYFPLPDCELTTP